MAEDFVFKIRAVPDLSGFETALKAELKKLKFGFNVPAAFTGAYASTRGGNAGVASMVHAERNATKALLNFSSAVAQATRGLSGFSAKAAGARNAGAALAGPVGGGAGNGQGFANAMMAVPGVAQIFGFAKAFPSTAVKWSRGNVGLAETQQRAETQLGKILENGIRNGKSYDSGTLGRLKAAASAEQERSMYGDEAILGGVGELSSYVGNEATLKRMIPLLTDYAAGMTGGGAVDYRGMIDLATGLGKALDGVYDNLKKKGFDTSELEDLTSREKAGETISDDMKVSALERALADYKGLAKAMAETPMGIIEQVKNSVGDAREEAGFLMQETLVPIFKDLRDMLPEIREGVRGLGEAAASFVNSFGNIAESVVPALAKIAKHSQLVIGAVTAGTAAFIMASGKAAKSFFELSTSLNNVASAAGNAAGESSLGGVTKGLGGLGNVAGTIVKGALLSTLAGELGAIADATVKWYQQWRKENATDEQRNEYSKASDAFLDARKAYLEAVKNGTATEKMNAFQDYQVAGIKLQEANKKFANGEFAKVELTEADRRRLGIAEEARQEGKKDGQAAKPPKLPKPVVNISADFNSISRLVKENLAEILRSQLRVVNDYQAVNV